VFEKVQKLIAVTAVLGAIAIGSAVVANAASSGSDSSSSGSSSQQRSAPTGVPPQRADETLLRGDTAAKVRQAALDKVSGATVIRVETDAEGSPYEAHLRKSDGSLVTVKVNKDFEVTATESGFGAGPGPGGGPGAGAQGSSGSY
jgi:hypothetical protein